VIFSSEDFADTFFMIYEGKVSLVSENGMTIATYKTGDLIGDSDVLLNENRDSKCVADTDCVLFEVKLENIEKLLDESPIMNDLMMKNATVKREKHMTKIKALEKRFPIFGLAPVNGELDERQLMNIEKLKKYGINIPVGGERDNTEKKA
jgi:CRP-like cAMP-binding protein